MTQKDIIAAVNTHVRDVKKTVASDMPKRIAMLTRVYWLKQQGKKLFCTQEFEANSKLKDSEQLRLVLQEVLNGTGHLGEHLWHLGVRCAGRLRPSWLPESHRPIGITFSCEANWAEKITPHSEGRMVTGIPILVIAGRTATGTSHLKLLPVATNGEDGNSRVLGLSCPGKMKSDIERMRVGEQVDFCRPFFDGFNDASSPCPFI